MLAETATLSGVPIHPLRLIAELQDILTPDVTVCSDMARSACTWRAIFIVFAPVNFSAEREVV
jgi:hypothetical protein